MSYRHNFLVFLNFIIDTLNWFLNIMPDLGHFLQQGLSEPEFYGDLVYKFKKNNRESRIF